jgi:uncharacterized protein (TIGR00369 family)
MTAWEATNPDFERDVKDAVLSMPAAMHLGFCFGRLTPGEAEIIQPYRKELTQHDGYFQGGVLGSLADFAAGSAAGTLLPPGWANMTIDYTVKIVAPAKGERIAARGRVVRPGSLITVAAADIYSIEAPADGPTDSTGESVKETLCAVALVTLRNIKVSRA